MDDDTTPRDANDDDTAGHVLHGEAAQNPVTGGRAPSLRGAQLGSDEDDVEGHMKTRKAAHLDDEGDDPDGPQLAR
jgi:hypothetical protein